MKFIIFHDNGPDTLGRRSFSLVWWEQDGIDRPELHKYDGKPVGYRRAQHYFMRPTLFLDMHTEATEEEADARIAEQEEQRA